MPTPYPNVIIHANLLVVIAKKISFAVKEEIVSSTSTVSFFHIYIFHLKTFLFLGEADPSQCKYNEELVEKGYYENTCDDPPPLETDKPFVDPKNPLPRGCYCPQPYVRIESGQCAVYARCASQQSESQQSA